MHLKRFAVLSSIILSAILLLVVTIGAASLATASPLPAPDDSPSRPQPGEPLDLGQGADVFVRPGWERLLRVDEIDLDPSTEGPESISDSFIEFNSGAGGDSCFMPDTYQTFCFRAESQTNDYECALDQFLRFPQDWTITHAYDAGPTTCENGSFSEFGQWFNHLDRPYEVQVDQDRIHANPSDRCITNICFDASTGNGPADAEVSWYWDSDSYGEPPHHPCSSDGYTPEGQPYECDQMICPPAAPRSGSFSASRPRATP